MNYGQSRQMEQRMLQLFLSLVLIIVTTPAWAVNYANDANCVVAWLFNETSGDAQDECSGGTYDGTVGSGVTQGETGQFDNAYNFDNTSNANVDGGDISEIDSASDLSICAWVYHDTITDDDYIGAKSNGATDGFLFFRDNQGSVSNRLNTYTIFVADSTDTSNARIESVENASSAGTWTHVCATMDLGTSCSGSTDCLRLYIDGTEDSQSGVSLSSIAAIDVGANNFKVGNNSADGSPTNGDIDEVIVFDRIIDSTEVNDIMDNGITGGAVSGPLKGAIINIHFSHMKMPLPLRKEYSYYEIDKVFEIINRRSRVGLLADAN